MENRAGQWGIATLFVSLAILPDDALAQRGGGSPITTLTGEDMERMSGQPWKCDAPAREWLAQSLGRIDTLQPGATRAGLLQLFQPREGSRFAQRFEYREHRDAASFFIDVEFQRDPAASADPDRDRIRKISAPFVEASASLSNPTWLEEALQRMRTVVPGATRARLLQVFREEGGLSTPLSRTYVSRDCPFFSVHVEFEPAGRPARDGDGRVTMIEAPEDRVIAISAPFLAYETSD
jgi:hypothetical protein